MSEESLVPDETRAMVGKVLGEPSSAVITAKESQRYAHAFDGLNPLFFDEDFARQHGYRTIICPPTFIAHAVIQSRPVADLREDGIYRTPSGAKQRPRVNARRVMFGGEEWDFLQPVYVGDTITAVTRFAGVEEKQGSSGPFVLMTNETTYTNQDGEVVARARGRSIAR